MCSVHAVQMRCTRSNAATTLTFHASALTMATLAMATLAMATLAMATLAMATLAMATLTMATLAMATLAMATLAMATLTMAPLTMDTLAFHVSVKSMLSLAQPHTPLVGSATVMRPSMNLTSSAW
eukprot:scaffold95422_cov57-Phaeocystis_antarctica.AAC.2